ncbi:hypothetical protein H0H92_007296 [Tricholoma furcatifolium]|nr:hypothetical protein H0H92_007296 [Tricholoma furcatifolium]
MSSSNDDAVPIQRRPLDQSLYFLDGEELGFYQELTGIHDEEELKQHIIAVQEKAYQVYHYPCIRRFAFTKLKISHLPAYQKALALYKEHPNALFLDIGCCFGNDIRKMVIDGWPVENALASDLRSAFWDYGHDLFKSTPESFPATFIAGDAFDSGFIAPRKPFYAPEEPAPLNQPLNALKSLTPLQGRLSAVHASSFFHLFDEAGQLQLARQVATLLSPAPGSIIFGMHGGKPEKGFRTEAISSSGNYMFCHSPETWKEVWDGDVFVRGSVKVEAGLHEVERKDMTAVTPGAKFYVMWWSVTRL